jgi:hypothetical protein
VPPDAYVLTDSSCVPLRLVSGPATPTANMSGGYSLGRIPLATSPRGRCTPLPIVKCKPLQRALAPQPSRACVNGPLPRPAHSSTCGSVQTHNWALPLCPPSNPALHCWMCVAAHPLRHLCLNRAMPLFTLQPLLLLRGLPSSAQGAAASCELLPLPGALNCAALALHWRGTR